MSFWYFIIPTNRAYSAVIDSLALVWKFNKTDKFCNRPTIFWLSSLFFFKFYSTGFICCYFLHFLKYTVCPFVFWVGVRGKYKCKRRGWRATARRYWLMMNSTANYLLTYWLMMKSTAGAFFNYYRVFVYVCLSVATTNLQLRTMALNKFWHDWQTYYPASGRGTGYCFRAISFFLSLFLCQQHYEKTAGPICMKFSGKVWSDHGMTWLHWHQSIARMRLPVSSPGPILHRSEIGWLIGWKFFANFLLPHSHLMPSLGANPFKFLGELTITNTTVLRLSVGEDFVILACIVLSQCQRVTDGWRERRTDNSTVANTGLSIASYADAQ